MKNFARALLGLVFLTGFVACGNDELSTNRFPEPPVLETVVPGILFLRGPDGEFIAGNEFESKDQVHLVGAGLDDGDYVYQVTDVDCEVRLAAPAPTNPAVPDTSGDVITVKNGAFGPSPVAPFLTNPREDEFYTAHLTPIASFTDDEEVGCFGFPELETLTVRFRVDVQPVPADPGESVDPAAEP